MRQKTARLPQTGGGTYSSRGRCALGWGDSKEKRECVAGEATQAAAASPRRTTPGGPSRSARALWGDMLADGFSDVVQFLRRPCHLASSTPPSVSLSHCTTGYILSRPCHAARGRHWRCREAQGNAEQGRRPSPTQRRGACSLRGCGVHLTSGATTQGPSPPPPTGGRLCTSCPLVVHYPLPAALKTHLPCPEELPYW